jgi:hypothetical protein
MGIRLLSLICAFGLAGCANDPLIFASGTTYGLKISASPKQDEPVKFVIGYDQVDATLIPTTMDKSRERIMSINDECDAGDGSDACQDIVSATAVAVPVAAVEQIKQATEALSEADIPDSGDTKSLFMTKEALDSLSETFQSLKLDDSAATIVVDPSQQATIRDAARVLSEAKVEDTATKEKVEEAAKPIQQAADTIRKAARARSQNDTLSVISSFNAGADVSASTGVSISAQLGKIFATGIAAQHVAEGIGKSVRPATVDPIACMQQFQKTLGKAPSEEAILQLCAPAKPAEGS